MRLTPEAESLVDEKTVIYVPTDVAKWPQLENIVVVSKKVLGDVPDVYVAGAAVFEPVRIAVQVLSVSLIRSLNTNDAI